MPTSTFQYTGPAAATAAVGGAVVYHAYATIPRGTTPTVQLTVDFPTGLAFQKGANLVASAGIFCGGIACALPVPTVGSNGSSATWTLSNVTDSNPSSSAVDTIQWDVVSIVENDSTAHAGVTLSNTGSYAVGASNGTFSSNAVTVVEPSLTFSTTSTPALAAANDLVTVTVQVKNPTTTNGANAYDAVATYTLPAGKLDCGDRELPRRLLPDRDADAGGHQRLVLLRVDSARHHLQLLLPGAARRQHQSAGDRGRHRRRHLDQPSREISRSRRAATRATPPSAPAIPAIRAAPR